MRLKLIYSGLAAGALAVSGLAAVLPGAATAGTVASHAVHVCSAHATAGHATCYAMAMTASRDGRLVGHSTPLDAAFTPTDIQKAYKLTRLKSGGATVAIVDAYGYPSLASDLATFRSQYGLPACTTSNGCLTIMGQTGGAPPGGSDSGWDLEQALDVDAVSSACPDCNILVVEGNSNSWSDLEAAENTAAKQKGVVAISNSYGGGNMSNNSAYDHAGIAITASTGDSGYNGGSYPSSDTHVVAVGGTSVHKSSGYSETVWSGAGSGCGTNPQPKWQKRAKTTCSTKASADVSAAADPNYGGLNVYDSGYGGWIQVGGTSEASPIIAAVFALSGKTTGYPAKFLYAKKAKKHLHDITSGSNGSCGIPVCTARKGWDGPTGMGTPKGAKAF